MRPEEKNKQDDVKLIRVASKDIFGDKKVYVGLTEIRGISWMFSNAICRNLSIDKNKRIDELSEKEIKEIEDFISHPDSPLLAFLKNRRKDNDSGIDKHLVGADLDLQKEFDIKGMKKMKSYRGIRHTLGQPVRGQRTKSNFRKNKSKNGGMKKK